MPSQIAARHMTRQELYELVWSEPMSRLAERFDISDRGLAKICAKAGIPVPERGYWARLQAGQAVDKTLLPSPAPHTPQHVTIRLPAPHVLHHLLSKTADDPPKEEQIVAGPVYEQRNQQWQTDDEGWAIELEQKKQEILLSRLVHQARDHRRASEIRAFVSQVATSHQANKQPEEFRRWRDWALRQADDIDPMRNERLFDQAVSDTELWTYNGTIGG